MVRITTVWDKIDDVPTKVFQVRGDEAYARTTDVKFSLKSSMTDSLEGFVATAIIDVLRDTGDSSITIYDGEDVLSVVNWTNSTNNLEVALPSLSWDTEHQLWCRYNGNSQCLKSKSDTITLERSNPNLTATSITNTTSTVNYTSSQSITITGTLNRASGSASLQGREIEFFVDGISKGVANTSNTSGAVSKSIGTLSNGLHEIAIVFSGDSPLGASETKFNISVGYILDVFEYPPTFINHINNTVKVKVTNYMGEPVSGKSVSFASKSATTDSNGVATINNITSITNNATYYASHSGYTSENIVMKSATLTGIEISTDDGVTVNGMIEPVTVSVIGTGTLSNIPISIGGAMSGTYMTSNSGIVTFDYMGSSLGNVTITATLPDTTLDPSIVTASTLIQDLLYYAKARTFNNTTPTITRATIDEQSSYIITPTDPFQYGYVHYDIPVHYWEATFTLVNFSGKYRDGININDARLDSSYNLGDVITVRNDEDGFSVKRNDTVVLSDSSDRDYLAFNVNYNSTYGGGLKVRMFFDNLKIRSL